MGPIERIADGVRLRVKAVPRSSRSEAAGVYGDMIRIRLTAPPVEGAANDALVRFLAEALSVPVKAILIVSGQSSRSKVVEISGVSPQEVAARLGM